MKKNRALKNWVITVFVGLILTYLFVFLATLLNKTGLINSSANVWMKDWIDYVAVFQVAISTNLWTQCDKYSLVFFILFGLTLLVFLVTFILSLCKENKKRYIWLAFFELVLGLVFTYVYLLPFSANFFEFSNGKIEAVASYQVSGAIVNIFRNPSNNVWEIFYFVVLAAVIAVFGISILGIFFTGLYRICKKDAAKEAKEQKLVEVAPAIETPVVAPLPEKKKGILIVKRYDKLGDFGPLVEKKEETSYPKEPITQKSLTIEEVRAAIKEEIEKAETKRIVEEYKEDRNAQKIANAIVKAQEKSESKKETALVEDKTLTGDKEEEKKIYPTPVVFAIPTDVREEFEVKETKVEEKPKVEVKPTNEGLSEEKVKEIIASEIKEALKDFAIIHETIIEKPVEVRIENAPVEEAKETVKEEKVTEEKAPESVVEETKPAEEVETDEVPVTEVKVEEVKEETPVEEKTEETKVETSPFVEDKKEETDKVVVEEVPAQEETKEPVVEETTAEPAPEVTPEALEGEPAEKAKIVRIPFDQRMAQADDVVKGSYNELKSLLKSYGLNNRIANGGDSFRLHRVTYCKITIAGKSLKLYLALNPNDYANSTYPIKDASSKAIYKETPLVFKVRSGLSLRRAEELIRDCMDKHGLEQIEQVQVKDWASNLASEHIDEDGDDYADDDE